MDARIRTQIGLVILAFAIVFVWGAVLSVSFLGPPSFSAQSLTAFSESAGAPALAVGTSTFSFFIIIGILLVAGFIVILKKSSHQH